MKTQILTSVLTLLMMVGVQYLLTSEGERYRGVADMRIDSMQQELVAAQMPSEQIGVIVGSIRDMGGL